MQQGYIFQRGKSWVVKYYETVLVGGQPKKRRVLKRLAPVCREYQTPSSVEHLAADLLAPINSKTARPAVTDTLAQFIESYYLPHCKVELRPSTYASYSLAWGLMQPHVNGLRLRAARTSDVEAILRSLAAEKMRARTTFANCRNFLSGAFRYAIRTDAYQRENPVREVKTPKGLRPQHQHAYTLDEVTAMLAAVDEPARTVLLVFALTGLRHCEVRGLRWEDFNGDQFNVSRSVWGKWIGETKTAGSAAPVPCVGVLKKALLAHKKRVPASEWIFAGEKMGRPLVIANLYRRDIKAKLEKAGVPWHGWHAFRRGVGSILNELGVDDSVIQSILRHANVQTTQKFYIKVASPQSTAALRKFEQAFAKARRKK
jgi:integrase